MPAGESPASGRVACRTPGLQLPPLAPQNLSTCYSGLYQEDRRYDPEKRAFKNASHTVCEYFFAAGRVRHQPAGFSPQRYIQAGVSRCGRTVLCSPKYLCLHRLHPRSGPDHPAPEASRKEQLEQPETARRFPLKACDGEKMTKNPDISPAMVRLEKESVTWHRLSHWVLSQRVMRLC